MRGRYPRRVARVFPANYLAIAQKIYSARQQAGICRQSGDHGVESLRMQFGGGEQLLDVACEEQLDHPAVVGVQRRPVDRA